MARLTLDDFSGGINRRTRPDKIDPRQAVVAKNVEVFDGTLSALPGPSGDAVAGGRSMFRWFSGDDGLIKRREEADFTTQNGRLYVTGLAQPDEYFADLTLVQDGQLQVAEKDSNEFAFAGVPYVSGQKDLEPFFSQKVEYAIKAALSESVAGVPETSAETRIVANKISCKNRAVLESLRVGDWLLVHGLGSYESEDYRLDPSATPFGDRRAVIIAISEIREVPGSVVVEEFSETYFAIDIILSEYEELTSEAGRDGLLGNLMFPTPPPFIRTTVGPNDVPLFLSDTVDILIARGESGVLPEVGEFTTLELADRIYFNDDSLAIGGLFSLDGSVFAKTTFTRVEKDEDDFRLFFTSINNSISPYDVIHVGTTGNIDTYHRYLALSDQGNNALEALEALGTYKYLLTAEFSRGLETAPLPPGGTEYPEIIIEESRELADAIEQTTQDNESPWWWPKSTSPRYTVQFRLAEAIPTMALFPFRPGVAVKKYNLYRTLRDGADFFLVKSWEIEEMPDFYTDDMRDFTLSSNTLLSAQDNYPPLLAKEDDESDWALASMKFVGNVGGVLFAASKHRLHYSKPNLPEYWPLLNFIDMPDEIVARAVYGPYQLVWCANGELYRVTGNTNATIAMTLLSSEHGNFSHRATQNLSGRLVWVSPDGICTFAGALPELMSQSSLGNEKINPSHAVVHNGEYWLWTTGDEHYRMSILDGLRFTTHTIGADASYYDHENDEVLIAQKINLPNPFDQEFETHQVLTWLAGDPVEMSWRSMEMPVGSIAKPAHLSRGFVEFSGNLIITLYLDGTEETSWPLESDDVVSSPFRLPPELRGRKLAIGVSGTGSLYGIQISYNGLSFSSQSSRSM